MYGCVASSEVRRTSMAAALAGDSALEGRRQGTSPAAAASWTVRKCKALDWAASQVYQRLSSGWWHSRQPRPRCRRPRRMRLPRCRWRPRRRRRRPQQSISTAAIFLEPRRPDVLGSTTHGGRRALAPSSGGGSRRTVAVTTNYSLQQRSSDGLGTNSRSSRPVRSQLTNKPWTSWNAGWNVLKFIWPYIFGCHKPVKSVH